MRPQVAIRQPDPPIAVVEEIENEADRRLAGAAPIIGAAHVVDDRGKVDLAQFVGDDQKVIFEAEHLDEPAKLADAVESTAEFRVTWRQFDPTAEIEPRSAHADAVQSVQLGVADAVVDDGDAAI